MGFKDWLDILENGTCTASIAVFARPMLPIVRRLSPVDFIAGADDFLRGILSEPEEDEEEKPKKKKKKSKSKKKD